MRSRWAPVLCTLGAALVWGGCQETSDVGKSCVLVRKPTAEEKARGLSNVPLYESEIPKPAAGQPPQDFISFGSTQCEDLICVRDAYYVSNAGPNDTALGYCSKACVENSPNACTPTSEEAPVELRNRIGCRSLLLDQQQLEKLRTEDPVGYRRTFGDNFSTSFCAGKQPT